MNYRLSSAARTAMRYSVVVTLLLVFAVGSLVQGQRKRPRKAVSNPTRAIPAASVTTRPAFQGFPVDQPQTIDLEIDENTIAGFSNRERLDQIRDWLLFTVIADAGLTADATNKILFDLPSSRRGYMVPVASFEYSSTRSRVIGNGRIVALLSQTSDEATRADDLAQIVDQHRKNLGQLPSSVIVFDYTIDSASNSAQLTRRAEVSAQQFFTEANGYFETHVSSLNDLERFMRQVDDITYATLENGTLILGGRRVKGHTYRGIRVEDVAAIWQSEQAIKATGDSIDEFATKLERQFNDAWRTYADVVNSLSSGNPAAANIALTKLRGLTPGELSTRAQLIRNEPSDSSPNPATVAYQAALNIVDAFNSGNVTTYNQLVISNRAVREEQMNVLLQYAVNKFKDLHPVNSSGFSLDPTYDFAAVSKSFATELEPLLREVQAQDPSLVSQRDIDQVRAAFADNNADPFFLLLGKISKAGLTGEAGRLQRKLEDKFGFQQARYDGKLQGTEVGMVLFYTDLLAKLWAFDFQSSTPSAHIADFYPLNDEPISLAHKANLDSAPNTRLWFGPQNKGFQFAKNPGMSLLFSRTAARVYAASSDPFKPGAEVEANAQSAAFLGWWDSHYEEIARYEPEYERLNEIMKWSVLVGWLHHTDHLAALNFLTDVQVYRLNRFPEWVQRQPMLRFKDWDRIGFYPARYNGSTIQSEALPLLSSNIITFGEHYILSGGVSLASRETFSARTPLSAEVKVPDIVRRSDLEYAHAQPGPRIPSSFSNLEGTNWRTGTSGPNESELIAVAKKGKAFRDGSAELKSDIPVKRTSTLKPDGMGVKTFAGNVAVSDLDIARTTNGFKIGAQSRAMDTGHVIARQLSVAEDPLAVLKTTPDVEEAYLLDQRAEFVIKMRGTNQWLRVGPENSSTSTARWQSRVAEFGDDAAVLRLDWISEQQARNLARTGTPVRAASENSGVARVDAFLADNKPVDALRALDELAPTEISEPDRILRRAVAQIARNRTQDAYDSLRQVFKDRTQQDVDQLFDEFNARLRASHVLPEGDQFLPVQEGQQITLMYRSRLGKPLSAAESKDLDISGTYLFVEDRQGLGDLDWSPGMEARTLQQVIAGDLGEVVRLPRGSIAMFRPAFITDEGGSGGRNDADRSDGARTRRFRSVGGSSPGSPLRTSMTIPCINSDNDDPAKRRRDDHSPCAKRDDKDRPVYVIVKKIR